MDSNDSNDVFCKIQLKLLLECSNDKNPNNDFCMSWISSNSQKLREYWDNSNSCKSCKFNSNCISLFDLMKSVIKND